MGYYSYFRLEVPTAQDEHERDVFQAQIEEDLGLYFEEPMKWYSFSEDMTAYSKRFPEHIFEFLIEGEERDDT